MLEQVGFGCSIVRFSERVCRFADLYDPEDDYFVRFLDYFIELAWFQIYETAIMLGVAYLFGAFHESLFCMLGFLPFRVTGKGVHADTKIKCILFSTGSFLVLGLIGSLFNYYVCVLLGVLFAFILRKD